MLTLRAIHAHEGDCLLLVYGQGDRFVLVDGGPRNTFGPHLARVLGALAPRRLAAVCLSHVDTDHTTGLAELFAELRDQKDEGDPLLVEIDAFWINQFSETIDADGADREGRLESVLSQLAVANQALALSSATLAGIKHGHELVLLARQLGIPINRPAGGNPFVAGETQAIPLDAATTLTIVGPTRRNLEALRGQWEGWLQRQEERVARGRFQLAANSDKSIPNWSSIQLLVESGGKRALLTGDGRGDHILEALEDDGLLDAAGGIDVDVLKVQHHGSDRNGNQSFFERVRARTYVISANGKDDNPDRPTLEWIWKAARKQGRTFELVLTNLPPDAEEFTRQRPPGNDYTLRVRDPGDDFIDVPIA